MTERNMKGEIDNAPKKRICTIQELTMGTFNGKVEVDVT
jgi:hypothetical protein